MILNKKKMKIQKPMLESVAKSTFEEFNLENGFRLLCFRNESDDVQRFDREIDHSFIQLPDDKTTFKKGEVYKIIRYR